MKLPATIRYSTIVHRLRTLETEADVEKFQKEIDKIGRSCKKHGVLEDPCIFVDVARSALVVACPWCSDPLILQQWEEERLKS